MIDYTKRRIAANLLKRLLNGRLTNDEFTDEFSNTIDPHLGSGNTDSAIPAIYSAAESLTSGYMTHHLRDNYRISKDQQEDVCRWILFLHTHFEYRWPVTDFNYRFVDIVMNILTGGLWLRAKKREYDKLYESMGDWSIWPFMEAAELEWARNNVRIMGSIPEGKLVEDRGQPSDQ